MSPANHRRTPSAAQEQMLATFMAVGPNHAFGLRLDHADGDRVDVSWSIDDRHLQTYGIVHGGVYCAVVETAGSIGGGLWFGDQGRVVGLANHTEFLRPVTHGCSLTATALPLHRGRTQQLWEVRISDDSARLMAHGQLRLQNVPHLAE
ncbi:PaaI family thioesterase [Mycolicibacterium helvum]|uniref:Putative phenylacetic acid degradation-related protein n=1 Tax=Mycolicibacterium helvum TaxID=1534349 RepID=A0A7I7TCW1_9MYCO|nr:PaaI family thioesterase [Mycolicibacterium helvum]BBY67027.1 putative phenylacetic acid degradation-related protein [Mycolicibacterium helvum]